MTRATLEYIKKVTTDWMLQLIADILINRINLTKK